MSEEEEKQQPLSDHTFIIDSLKINASFQGIHISIKTHSGLFIKVPYLNGEEILKQFDQLGFTLSSFHKVCGNCLHITCLDVVKHGVRWSTAESKVLRGVKENIKEDYDTTSKMLGKRTRRKEKAKRKQAKRKSNKLDKTPVQIKKN